MYRDIQVVVVNGTKHSPQFTWKKSVDFAERVRDGETPIEAATRRANELYPMWCFSMERIRVRVERECIETGNSTLVTEYFI